MVTLMWGKVIKIHQSLPDRYDLSVMIDQKEHKAIAYPDLTGIPREGDRVLLNVTATCLRLGTGGVDFVVAIETWENKELDPLMRGIKMRYSPFQVPCTMIEEMNSSYQIEYQSLSSLNDTPFIIGELHSMVTPIAAFLHDRGFHKVSYIMTDHAALPIAFSNTIQELKEKGLIYKTITIGNAFGGDYECVNIYTALITAVRVLKSQVVIITMGPGIYGTGTALGFSGLELGHYADAVSLLEGRTLFVPRISFSDNRARHYGISHHSITLLMEIIQRSCHIAIPIIQNKEKRKFLFHQIHCHQIFFKHKIFFKKTERVDRLLDKYQLHPTSMGRNYQQDSIFFDTAVAAAGLALRYIK